MQKHVKVRITYDPIWHKDPCVVRCKDHDEARRIAKLFRNFAIGMKSVKIIKNKKIKDKNHDL